MVSTEGSDMLVGLFCVAAVAVCVMCDEKGTWLWLRIGVDVQSQILSDPLKASLLSISSRSLCYLGQSPLVCFSVLALSFNQGIPDKCHKPSEVI